MEVCPVTVADTEYLFVSCVHHVIDNGHGNPVSREVSIILQIVV